MRRRRVRAWLAIALGLCTGVGHLYLRRYAQGVALFALFAAAANGVLLGALLQGDEARLVSLASQAALAGVWVLGLASVLRLTVFTDREALAKRREEKIREGLVHYLREENRQALEAFEEARACDVDHGDVDVLFYLGAVSSRLGRKRAAVGFFKRCLAWDGARKWRGEIEVELLRLAGHRPERAAVRAGGPPSNEEDDDEDEA